MSDDGVTPRDSLDPLDWLLDLYREPMEGDDSLAKWLRGRLRDEAKAAVGEAAKGRARARVLMGEEACERICDALTKEAA